MFKKHTQFYTWLSLKQVWHISSAWPLWAARGQVQHISSAVLTLGGAPADDSDIRVSPYKAPWPPAAHPLHTARTRTERDPYLDDAPPRSVLPLILYVRTLSYLLRHGHPVTLVVVVRPPVPPVHMPSRSGGSRARLPCRSLCVALAAAAASRPSGRQCVRLLRPRTVTPAAEFGNLGSVLVRRYAEYAYASQLAAALAASVQQRAAVSTPS